MKFDWFVLPFSIGLIGLLIFLIFHYSMWIKQLNKEHNINLFKIFFSTKLFKIIYEIFLEALLHRRIFKINPVLGYMHSSFAFGWFLLIVFGAIETNLFGTKPINHLYEPIFFKFFYHNTPNNKLHLTINFIMDLLLLYILSGLLIAIIKRFYSKIVGLKKTTRTYWTDKLAMYSLWLIFPLRLIAESSYTAIYHHGSFLTNFTGNLFEQMFNISSAGKFFWWAYSIDLFIFFSFLPFSRYMHIPTEIILIALRKIGFTTQKEISIFSKIEILSCSSCGICIDNCQIQSLINKNNMVPAYLFQKERHSKVLKADLYNCLMCGRCQNSCPVQINILNIKLAKRSEKLNKRPQEYDYLDSIQIRPQKTKIAYYAGCMTHLTPSIIKAMTKIFNMLKVDYTLLDKNGTICCGRPLLLAGKYQDAKKLIEKNTEIIQNSEATLLLTSCPICYKMFNEEYKLNIKILHHTQWLEEQIDNLNIFKQNIKAAYHDPCDLGRGSKIYDSPRNVISKCLDFQENSIYIKANSLCCGGSLGNLYINENERVKIASNTFDILTYNKDCLVTSCPLCKKTFQKVSTKPVYDIAEVVANSIIF